MESVSLQIKAHVPKQSYALEMIVGNKPAAHMILEAPELSALIASLGQAREALSDAVPFGIDPGTRSIVLVDPRWQVPLFHPENMRVLGLRHPGYGWLAFGFPEHEAETIARQLSGPLERRSTTPLRWETNPFEAPPPPKDLTRIEITFTGHAQNMIMERKILSEWINRALFAPDERESDPLDPEVVRHFKVIPERDGRVLRLAVVPLDTGVRIVTVFFDRGKGRR